MNLILLILWPIIGFLQIKKGVTISGYVGCWIVLLIELFGNCVNDYSGDT